MGAHQYPATISRDKNSLAHKITRAIPGVLMILVSSVLYYQVIYHPYNFYNVKSPFIFVFFYHLYLTTFIAIFGYKGIKLLKKTEERDFKKEYLDKINSNYNLKYIPWEQVIHYVIVPNYKEHMSTLEEMLDYIAASTMAKTNIIPVLAMEEREKESPQKAKDLIAKYSASFMDIISCFHPPGIPGETPGKSSNESWAGKFVMDHVEQKGYDKDSIVITIADADSCLHKKYFENLTLNFCTDESSRYIKIWQAPVCNYKNFFDIPAAVNFTSFSFSLHELAHLTDVRDFHIPFSTYSLSLNLAQQAGGWDADIIPEDWHMYLKSFFATGGAVDVEPIHLPTLCYAVEGDTYWHTINDRYVQAKRHSWGICEISYMAYKFYETFFQNPQSNAKKPSILKCLVIFFKMCVIHYTSSLFAGVLFANIVMTLTGKNYIGRYYPFFLVLYYVPQMSIAVVNYLYMKFLFPNKKNMEITTVFLVLKWNALRDILFVIFYYTALDASLKQMFTDNFNYIVATKPVTKPKE